MDEQKDVADFLSPIWGLTGYFGGLSAAACFDFRYGNSFQNMNCACVAGRDNSEHPDSSFLFTKC